MNRDYKSENEEYNKLNLSKKIDKETLSEFQHKLFLEGFKDRELAKVYLDLKEMEIIDLTDLLEQERRNGGV